MRFDLTHEEIKLLEDKGVSVDETRDYTDDEALNLLDMVRDIEVSYSQFTGGVEKTLYFQYGDLADKMQSQIPEY